MSKAKTLLENARAKLEKPENWIQHNLISGHDKFCLLGALWFSRSPIPGPGSHNFADGEDSYNQAYKVVEDILRHRENSLKWPAYDLVQWNNHPERKHSEILEVLDKAIKASEAKAIANA